MNAEYRTRRNIACMMAELFEAWLLRDNKLNREYVGGYIGRNVRKLTLLQELAKPVYRK